LLEGQRIGKWHRIGRLYVDDLRVAAEPGAREYPLPHPCCRCAVADSLNRPGHLVADDGGRLGRVGIEPDAGEVVGEVDPRGAHGDPYLSGAGRRWVRTFLDLKDRQVTVLGDHDRAHGLRRYHRVLHLIAGNGVMEMM